MADSHLESVSASAYQTEDYGLAAYLCYRNMSLVGAVGPKDVYRKSFVFIDHPDRQLFVEEWASNSTDEVRKLKRYFAKISMVKKALKEAEKHSDD